jgi:hypothetical protein
MGTQSRVAPKAVPIDDFPARTVDSDNLDIPSFLRRRN